MLKFNMPNPSFFTASFIGMLMFLLPLLGCTKRLSLIKNAEWLVGTWASNTEHGILYESWQKSDKYKLAGKSYFLEQGDTLLFETIQLLKEGDALYYIVTGAGGSEQGDIPFKSITVKPNHFVFENKLHDFPQTIMYKKITNDSLLAIVEGGKDSTYRQVKFPMRRIK